MIDLTGKDGRISGLAIINRLGQQYSKNERTLHGYKLPREPLLRFFE